MLTLLHQLTDYITALHNRDSMVEIMERVVALVIFIFHPLEETAEFFQWNLVFLNIFITLKHAPHQPELL